MKDRDVTGSCVLWDCLGKTGKAKPERKEQKSTAENSKNPVAGRQICRFEIYMRQALGFFLATDLAISVGFSVGLASVSVGVVSV